MKKFIPLVLVGILVFGTAVSASAKVLEKRSSTMTIMNYAATDPDFPDIK